MLASTYALVAKALADNPALHVLGDEVGRPGPTAAWAELAPGRVRALPVADRGTVGLALGLALSGQRALVHLPHVSALSAVLPLLVDAAAVQAGGEFRLALTLRVPVGGEAGPRLDQEIGTLLSALSGIRVWAASSPQHAERLLQAALQLDAPVILLEPRHTSLAPQLPDAAPEAPALLRAGGHLTLAAAGPAVSAALEAAEQLAAEGIDADVVALTQLSPLNSALLSERVRVTGRLLVVHSGDAALVSAIHQAVLASSFEFLESPLAEASITSSGAPANLARILAAARASTSW